MLQLVKGEMVVQMLFDEMQHFSSEMRILEHYHLHDCSQSMLLKHILEVRRHRQMVLELHRSEDLVNYPKRKYTFADIHRILLEVSRDLLRICEIDLNFFMLVVPFLWL